MLINEIVEILDAKVVCGENMLEQNIRVACGSDLMSDVLAFVDKENGVLLTGMLNQQVVRTADMLDMKCIVFVRGKEPEEDIVELAKSRGIALLSTRYRMFTACGMLYSAGLDGGCSE